MTEFTRFVEDLGVDDNRRRSYYQDISNTIRLEDCQLVDTTPDVFTSNDTVGGVVTAMWTDIQTHMPPPAEPDFHNLADFIAARTGGDGNRANRDYLRGYHDALAHLAQTLREEETA